MDQTTLCCLGIGVPALIVFSVVIYISIRKNPCGEIPPTDMNYLLNNIVAHCRARGWDAEPKPYSGKIHITKDSIVGTEMTFIQRPDGRISMFYTPSAGAIGWVLVIILLSTIFGALIIGIYLHFASGKFTREEVVPMITGGAAPIQVIASY